INRLCSHRLRALLFGVRSLLGFTFANPAFDAELAVNSVGLRKAVINIGPQRMERDAAPVILLDTRQFGSAQTASATDFDAFSAKVLGGLKGFLHRATERDAALELESDVFGDELGIGFRRLDFDDVHVNLLAGHLAEFLFELVDFRAFAANDDAGSGRQNRNAATAGGGLNQNLRHRGGLELLLEQLANLAVLRQQLAEFFFAGIPLGAPIAIHRDSKTDWICFLSHTTRNG